MGTAETSSVHGLSMVGLARASKSYWWLVGLIALIVGVPAYWYSIIQPREYNSSASIRLSAVDISSTGLQEIYQEVSESHAGGVSAAELEGGLSMSSASTSEPQTNLTLKLINHPDVQQILEDITQRIGGRAADSVVPALRVYIQQRLKTVEKALELRSTFGHQLEASAGTILTDGTVRVAEKIRLTELLSSYLSTMEGLENTRVTLERQFHDLSLPSIASAASPGKSFGQRSPIVFALLSALSAALITISILTIWQGATARPR